MYYNPVKIIETNNLKTELNKIISSQNLKNPLFITTKGTLARNNFDDLASKIPVYADVNPNPTLSECQNAIKWSLKYKVKTIFIYPHFTEQLSNFFYK